MDKVLIPAGLVDDDELDMLVQQIATMKYADATVTKQFIVESDSPALLAALRALFGDHTIKAEQRVKRNGERVRKRSKMVRRDGRGMETDPSLRLRMNRSRSRRAVHM